MNAEETQTKLRTVQRAIGLAMTKQVTLRSVHQEILAAGISAADPDARWVLGLDYYLAIRMISASASPDSGQFPTMDEVLTWQPEPEDRLMGYRMAILDWAGEPRLVGVNPRPTQPPRKETDLRKRCGHDELLYVDDRFHADGSRCRHKRKEPR